MGAAIEEAPAVNESERADARTVPQPNFFIAGSAKAGSTSLVDYLRQHPDIFMPGGSFSRKEPAHFCDPIPPWQEQYRDFNNYLGLFADAGNRKAIGEASVAYLASPGAENRIYARYPNAKIIIVLRNPADRAYSWYTFMCQYGIEGSPSFERALAEEKARAANAALAHENWVWYSATQYFRFGLCADDIARFVRRFPKEHMHFLLFEDLKARPQATTRAVYEFLEVDPSFTPTFEVHNPTWTPLSVRFQHFLARHTRIPPAAEPALPLRFRDRHVIPFAADLNAVLGRLRKRPFDPSIRRDLLNRYREDIRRTEALIGRNLDLWLEHAG